MKRKVVILSAFATPFRSGAEAMVEEVSALLNDDFEIVIVTARLRKDLPKEDVLPSGVRVMRVGMGSRFDKWLFPLLGALMAKRLKPKVVHAVLESYAGLGLVLCKTLMPRAKRVLTCQSTNTSLLVGAMHRAADVVTCISTPLIERARKFGRSDAILIPNGLHPKAYQQARKSEQRIPGRILFAGRLEAMKGVDTLLQAFVDVVKSHPEDTSIHLRVVGDGSERRPLEALAQKLGIEERVTLAGRVDPGRIMTEYAQAEIFCGLSRSEALGNVFLEAQAAGCAVVATNVGGIPDIVRHGETGMLVAPDRIHEAADAINGILNNPPLREQLSKAGIEHAKEFEWQGIAERYKQAYEDLL